MISLLVWCDGQVCDAAEARVSVLDRTLLYGLGAFETFFPEKRPFFQEGADIFNFGIGGGDENTESLFYSRRVGRRPRDDHFLHLRESPSRWPSVLFNSTAMPTSMSTTIGTEATLDLNRLDFSELGVQ